jgi:hypothetical protein
LDDDEDLVLPELVELVVGMPEVAEDRDVGRALVEDDRVVRGDQPAAGG